MANTHSAMCWVCVIDTLSVCSKKLGQYSSQFLPPPRTQRARRRQRVFRVKHPANHRQHIGTGRDNLASIGRGDAANRHARRAQCGAVGKQTERGAHGVRFGGGGADGAKGHVVGASGDGGVRQRQLVVDGTGLNELGVTSVTMTPLDLLA